MISIILCLLILECRSFSLVNQQKGLIDKIRSHLVYGDVENLRNVLSSSNNWWINDTLAFGGVAPLQLALKCRHVDIAYLLMEHGADVTISSNSSTPLQDAVSIGNLDLVKKIISKGGDVNKPCGNYHNTALSLSFRSGNKDLVKYLIGIVGTVNPVLDKDKRSKSVRYIPLHEAIRLGDIDILHLMSERYLDVDVLDENGEHPLALSHRLMRPDITEWLVGEGATIAEEGSRGKKKGKGKAQLVKEVDDEDAGPADARSTHVYQNKNGNTKLHTAIYSSNWEGVRKIKHKEKYTNVLNSEGLTPLGVLIHKTSKENQNMLLLVSDLLSSKSDPNLCGKGSISPLMCAVRLGFLNTVQKFVDANITVSDEVLHHCTNKRIEEILRSKIETK